MKRSLILLVTVCAVSLCGAAEYVLTATDPSATTSFNTTGKWNNAAAPAPGNTYRTGAYQMRTPENNTGVAYTFAGDRLTISIGGNLLWKCNGPVTVSDLYLDGAITHGYGGLTGQLLGTLTITNSGFFGAANTENDNRYFAIYSTLVGAGTLTIAMGHTNALKQTYLLADNSGFTGKLVLRGLGKFGLCAETAMGGNPAAFAPNQVAFDGMTLLATNSFAIDDSNRGFTLNNSLNTPSQIYPGGVFEVTGTNALTVACPIAGAGPLTKRGVGSLILATNNTYTGLTRVEAGTLRLAAGASHALSSLVVSGSTARVTGEGVLSNVTLIAGARLGAERGGWAMKSLDAQNTTNATFEIDLSEAQPNVTLIRVAGSVTKQVLQVFQFVINTNNTVETPYQILSASNLSAFADYDFCVTPPWAGELSRANDVGGGQVLLFTPTPPEKRAFLIASDPIDTTSFMLADKWSDGLSPTNLPTGVKTYVSTNSSLRTPYNRSMTFGGKRLIMDGQSIGLKGAAYITTINDLTMMNDASLSMSEPVKESLAGNILLRPILTTNKVYAMRVSGGTAGRNLFLYSTLTGYGDLFLQNQGNPAYSNNVFFLLASNTNFFGKTHVDGHTNFWLRFSGETALGMNPPFFRADQLRFNGGGISVTNDVTLDDNNRGITLLATGGTSPTDINLGGFTNGTPASVRYYPGGCVLRPEGTTTLSVTCPITGPGRLVKDGGGLLVLGGSNTFTGQTEIVAGTLEPVSTNALGIGPVLVHPSGRLLRRYPGPSMPSGVELGAGVTFAAGSQLVIKIDEGYPIARNFTVPLFSVPSSVTVDPATVPVQHSLPKNYKAVVTASTVDSRTMVSVQLMFQGTLITFQ